MTIPDVDLSSAAGVDDICRSIGFFRLTGHGVERQIIDAARFQALAFFDLPVAERMTVVMPEPGYPYGYGPLAAEALNRSIGGAAPPDLKETFNIGPIGPPPRPLGEMVDVDERAVYAPNLWPRDLADFRPAMEVYYDAMAHLAARVMSVFATELGLDSGWFDSKIDHHGSALRLAHYPALDSPPAPGALRAGAHTDYGTLTILLVDDQPGLQVETSRGWVDVEADAGELIVNLGDLMARWTNDRWRSTMHRVVVAGDASHRRLTIPFFHNANWNAQIECITTDGEPARYPTTTAGHHLMQKFRSTVAFPAM